MNDRTLHLPQGLGEPDTRAGRGRCEPHTRGDWGPSLRERPRGTQRRVARGEGTRDHAPTPHGSAHRQGRPAVRGESGEEEGVPAELKPAGSPGPTPSNSVLRGLGDV